MILTNELIKKNIKTYSEAREEFSIIIDYENGLVNNQTMRKTGLGDFADFHDFVKYLKIKGYNPIMDLTYRKLKPLLIENTKTERFKTYLKNRTQKKFISDITDYSKFNRLVNGRVISASRYRTRRSNEKIEGLSTCIVSVINYLITNKIDHPEWMKNFSGESKICLSTRWYYEKELNYDKVPKREVELTREMISRFIDIIDESNMDFRKFNIEYVTDALSSKIRGLMTIPNGTMIRCKEDVITQSGKVELSGGVSYEVKNSYIQNGFLTVMVKNDFNRTEYKQYSLFEDMKFKRDQLLNDLFS